MNLYELATYNREYSKWYTGEHCGGRHSATVGDLLLVLSTLPLDMPIKVSHQFDRHPVGILDPIWGARDIAVDVGMTAHGAPIMGRPKGGLVYFILE